MANALLLSRIVAAVGLLAVPNAFAAQRAQEFGQTDVSTCIRQQMNFAPDFVRFGGGGVLYAFPVERTSSQNRIRVLSRSIGRLAVKVQSPSGQETALWCTASLVANNLLITAHHCLPGDGVVRGPDGSRWLVTAAELELNYLRIGSQDVRRYPVESRPVAGNYNSALDYSIARVAGNPGRVFGTIAIQRRVLSSTDDLLIIHHARACPEMYSRSCKLSGNDSSSRLIQHRCATDEGSSGALIFSELDYNVIGIHSGAWVGGTAVNVGYRIDDLIADSPILQDLARKSAVTQGAAGFVPIGPTNARIALASAPATRHELDMLSASVRAAPASGQETRLPDAIQPRLDADPGWRDEHDAPKTCGDYAGLRWGSRWRIVASDIQCFDPAAARANRDFSEAYYAYRSYIRVHQDKAEEKSLFDEAIVLINLTTDTCRISSAHSPEDLHYPSRVARIAGCIVTMSGQRLARLQQRALRYLQSLRPCSGGILAADARTLLSKLRYSAADAGRIEGQVCRA